MDDHLSDEGLVGKIREPNASKPSIHHAVIRTELGDIFLELYAHNVPITVANFERLVEEGAYSNSRFYRTVHEDNQPNDTTKIGVIQGGLKDDKSHTYSSIVHETTDQTGIDHVDGTISMARLEPGTASTEFFICIDDQPELNYGGSRNPDGQGFAAFGKVTKGMEIVRAIQYKGDDNQYLSNPVVISNIELLTGDN
jgi:peptidyl-prolyl cis-trans isomerase A (cyclophilin A)